MYPLVRACICVFVCKDGESEDSERCARWQCPFTQRVLTQLTHTTDARTFYGFLNLSEEGRVPMSDHFAECQSTTNVADSIAESKEIIRLAL